MVFNLLQNTIDLTTVTQPVFDRSYFSHQTVFADLHGSAMQLILEMLNICLETGSTSHCLVCLVQANCVLAPLHFNLIVQ